jgi:hypothetical protein
VDKIGEVSPRSDEIRRNIEQAVKRQRALAYPNDDSKILDCIQNFLATAQTPPVTIEHINHEAALAIFRSFSFREITIGLRSESDGRYRYEEFFGISKTAENALRALSYSMEEFFDPVDYPAIRLSKVTELCIAEENPRLDLEKHTFDQKAFLTKARASPEEFIEGDYIDVSMYDAEDKLIGWIEVAKPMFNKMPTIQKLRRLELFAAVLSILIQKTLLAKKC